MGGEVQDTSKPTKKGEIRSSKGWGFQRPGFEKKRAESGFAVGPSTSLTLTKKKLKSPQAKERSCALGEMRTLRTYALTQKKN